MQRSKGFTATDLAIIVTVLAMAAALAVPRYMSLNADHRSRAVDSLAASADSFVRLSNKLWRTSGFPDAITVDGNFIEIVYGYPSTDAIEEMVVLNERFAYANGVWTHRDRRGDPGCSVIYTPPVREGGEARIARYTSGC